MATWELQRRWETVRYLVYYLVENLVPPELIPGVDIIDFSCGLGDLSAYMAAHGPASLIATSPEATTPPPYLPTSATHLEDVPADRIAERLPAASADLFVARMVFQFPTVEDHHIDMDGMLAQVYRVLRPGGRLIICSHQYTELDPHLEAAWPEPVETYFERLLATHDGPHHDYLAGLIELIQTIGIPPREGSHGQTGFGLKPSMAIDSFLQAGFQIERTAELEEFTFPIGLSREMAKRPEYYAQLAERVFATKQRHIQTPAFADKYQRPQVLRAILDELKPLHPFVTIPIFSIQACKPS
jgi:SAM-dependent methyltransferase